MDSHENIPAESPLDLHTTESQVQIPTEIWSKIISFLPIDDRCRVEGVNHQLSEAAKATWAQLQLKSLVIPTEVVDSEPKLLTLLRRCRPYLKEIIIQRHIRLDTETQLGQLCLKLKVLSFAGGSSLPLAKDESQPEVPIRQRVQQLLTSLPQLQRVQFFEPIEDENVAEGDAVVFLRDFLPELMNVPSLQELHLPLTWTDCPVDSLAELQQLRVLSVAMPPKRYFLMRTRLPTQFDFCQAIFRLNQLEELHLMVDGQQIKELTPAFTGRLAESLPNLRSLVLVFASVDSFIPSLIPSGCIAAMIDQFTHLRTLVIVRWGAGLEEFPVDLSEHRHRQVPLNIFVVVRCLSNFTGYSPQVNVVPMPSDHTADAIDFLSTYNQNGFDFKAEKCLQMVNMSKEFGGIWNFAYEIDLSFDDRDLYGGFEAMCE